MICTVAFRLHQFDRITEPSANCRVQDGNVRTCSHFCLNESEQKAVSWAERGILGDLGGIVTDATVALKDSDEAQSAEIGKGIVEFLRPTIEMGLHVLRRKL